MPLARHDFSLEFIPPHSTVSTHMPLARHDGTVIYFHRPYCCFYSHASCEAWLDFSSMSYVSQSFYSHASCEAWPARPFFVVHGDAFLLTCLLRGMTISAGVSLAGASFLLTCLLRGMTLIFRQCHMFHKVSTHMPLARHDCLACASRQYYKVSTHMPLARHDNTISNTPPEHNVSTHMPLARHDGNICRARLIAEVSTHMPLARHDILVTTRVF